MGMRYVKSHRGRSTLLRVGFVAGLGLVVLTTFPRETPASVEEQRARLPPPAQCTNDIEGTWLGLRWSSHRRPPEWYKVTLEVRYASPESKTDLTGSINVRFWKGGAEAQTPPSGCRYGEGLIYQPAKGKIIDGNIDFEALSWQSAMPGCEYTAGYYLDHYTGRIDPQILEFQAVNNDGGLAVNEPTVFRRIKCADVPGPTAMDVKVTPPSFTPRKKWSCH